MKKDYDAIIIGAGIGGLTCGSYLAKRGARVLIMEKNAVPGGYCVSFERKGFRFDGAAHCLGGFSEKGILRNIWEELGIDQYIKLIRSSPSDRFMFPKFEINIYSDLIKTRSEFEKYFPREKQNIHSFFKYVLNSTFPTVYFSWRGKTFADLIDSFFYDKWLKGILNLPLGTVGVPSSKLSAIAGVSLYKHFIFGGGYYPCEGMGAIPVSLDKVFRKLGGTIKYQTPATKFIIKSGRVEAVCSGDEVYTAKYFVSAMDLDSLFFNLIGLSHLPTSFTQALRKMIPTKSCFLVYIALKDYFTDSQGVNIWFNDTYDVDGFYKEVYTGELNLKSKFILVRLNPVTDRNMKKRTGALVINAPYLNKGFWDKNKNLVADNLIRRALRVRPDLQGKIEFYDAATPITLQNITGNLKGAMYGWAPIVNQVERSVLKLPFSNLFISGHWTSESWGFGGLMKSFLSGKSCAVKIIHNLNK